MPALCLSNEYVAAAAGCDIVVSSVSTGQETKLKCPSEVETPNETKKNIVETPDIILGAFSADCSLLAICDSFKRIFIWSTNNWTLKLTLEAEKKVVKLLFHANNTVLLVADRSGDVYAFDLTKADRSERGTLVFGHLSMLTDITFDHSHNHIITSDRDEKIRISNYPNCYNIHNYCLGHTQFVSSLCLLNEELLVSGSGDGTLRLWQYMTGTELFSYDCARDITFEGHGEHPPVRFVVRIAADRVAVSFYSVNSLVVYGICSNQIHFNERLNLPGEPLLAHHVNNALFVATSGDPVLTVFDTSDKLTPSSENNHVRIVKLVNSNTSFCDAYSKAYNRKEVDALYKQWYDNVKSYMQRKTDREEVLSDKKKSREEFVSAKKLRIEQNN